MPGRGDSWFLNARRTWLDGFCFALRTCTDEERRRIVIAGCFHDLGIWSDRTFDYLSPSVA